MRKKNEKIIEFKEKFVIPQINYSLEKLIKGKSKFQRSEIVSPIHGTNVLDKIHYVDNSGKLDIDYGYDFVRDEKHISDEEQIRRHGTKYYEFSFINKQLTEEEKIGSNYSKSPVKEEEKIISNNTLDSFFVSKDEIDTKEDELEIPINEPNLEDQTTEFKIHISLDDEDDLEYNSFSENLPKPSCTTIPSYLKTENTKKDDSRDFYLKEVEGRF